MSHATIIGALVLGLAACQSAGEKTAPEPVSSKVETAGAAGAAEAAPSAPPSQQADGLAPWEGMPRNCADAKSMRAAAIAEMQRMQALEVSAVTDRSLGDRIAGGVQYDIASAISALLPSELFGIGSELGTAVAGNDKLENHAGQQRANAASSEAERLRARVIVLDGDVSRLCVRGRPPKPAAQRPSAL